MIELMFALEAHVWTKKDAVISYYSFYNNFTQNYNKVNT